MNPTQLDDLIEIIREMREFFDQDSLCPICHRSAGHKPSCVAFRLDTLLLTIRADAAISKLNADQRLAPPTDASFGHYQDSSKL
jgi:hypothetical protein